MIVFKEKPVTLYHVTKKENLQEILKYGLLINKFKDRPENKLLGISKTGLIYFNLDKNKLVKPLRKDKDILLKIEIPRDVYDKMPKILGDPEWEISKKQRDYFKYKAEIMKKAYPESFKDKSIEDIRKKATPLEYMSPENTVCLLCDVPKEYIKYGNI